MAGSRGLALINKGSFRRLQRCLANLWFSLSPQHRKLILSVLLAGLLAEMHQRMGLWQRVKRLSGGRQRVLWPSSGSTRRSGAALKSQAEEEDGKDHGSVEDGRRLRHRLTRPVVLGDKGRAHCSRALRQQYLSRTNCDVVFSVDGRSFAAHRCWVAAFSLPLRAMFSTGMRDSQESVVHLKDTDAATFEMLLDFMYDGAVELSERNVESVLGLSVRYGVSALIEQCCGFLAGSINVSNAFGILTVADKYTCQPLRRDSLLYAVVHFEACWSSDRDGFGRLHKALVLDILGHDALSPTGGEGVVFWAAVDWLEQQARSHGAVRDHELVSEVMSHVRFPLVSPRVLAETVETHGLMKTEACRGYVLEAYRFQALSSSSASDGDAPIQAAAAAPTCAGDAAGLSPVGSERCRPRVGLRLVDTEAAADVVVECTSPSRSPMKGGGEELRRGVVEQQASPLLVKPAVTVRASGGYGDLFFGSPTAAAAVEEARSSFPSPAARTVSV